MNLIFWQDIFIFITSPEFGWGIIWSIKRDIEALDREFCLFWVFVTIPKCVLSRNIVLSYFMRLRVRLVVWIPLFLIAHKDIGHVVEGVSESWWSLWLVCRFRTFPTLLSRFCWHFWFVWIQISLIWCWCRNLGQVRSWSYLATLLNKNIFCVENPYFMIQNAGYKGLPYTLRKKGA